MTQSNRFITALLLFLLLQAGAWLRAEEQGAKSRFFDEWEVLYTAGSPWGTSEWRNVKNTVYTQKFTQMWQLSLCHQLKGREMGAVTSGYLYPSIGMYAQWLDFSHLKMRGREPYISADRHYTYGPIASAGFVMHQNCWMRDLWSGHLKVQVGAAYVFHPVYTSDGVATMAAPWQFLLGLGWYFDRVVSRDGNRVISFGPQFTHMSNSGLAAYNTGINNFSISVAFRHRAPRNTLACKAEDALREYDGSVFRRHYYTSVAAGLGGVYFEHSKHSNGQLTVMADGMFRFRPTHALGMGIDYYHCSQPDRCGRTDYVGTGIKYDHWWGRSVFHLQGGIYLNDRRPIKWKGMSRFYENIGYKFVFFRTRSVTPYVGAYSKGNGFNAEQMAFSLGMIMR